MALNADAATMRFHRALDDSQVQAVQSRPEGDCPGLEQLKYWSTNAGEWVQDAAAFDLWVGSNWLATLRADLVVAR